MEKTHKNGMLTNSLCYRSGWSLIIENGCAQYKYFSSLVVSGVTRVGDTRGATEGVTPLFFPEKPGDLFCSSLSLSLSLFIAFTRV